MRKLLKNVKPLVERLFDVRIYSARPHGRDDCHDLQRAGVPIRMIFDVGAHVGESARKFHHAFPEATIHSFEPVSRAFAQLRQNVAEDRKSTRLNSSYEWISYAVFCLKKKKKSKK